MNSLMTKAAELGPLPPDQAHAWLDALRAISDTPETLQAAFLAHTPAADERPALVAAAARAQHRLAETLNQGTGWRAYSEVIEAADTTGRQYLHRELKSSILPWLEADAAQRPLHQNAVYLGMAWFGLLAARQARQTGIDGEYFTVFRAINQPETLLHRAVACVDIDDWRSRGDLLLHARVRFDAVIAVTHPDHQEDHCAIAPYGLYQGPLAEATDAAGWHQSIRSADN